MSIINDDEWSSTCRVCLEKSSKLYPMEGPIFNVDVYASTMISYCTSTEIALEEDLPKGICVPCFKTLRIAYNFIKQFEEANEKLLAIREAKKIKFVDDRKEKCNDNDTDDMLEIKEELIEEKQTNDLSDQNCFNIEEKIIISYVNDNNSDHVEEVASQHDEDISEDDKKESKDASHENIILNRHVCPICSKIFPDFKRGLLRHLQVHDCSKLINCNKCSLEGGMTIDVYIQHYSKLHLYQCPICNKILSRSSFHSHSKRHINGISYRCPHENCQKSFQTRVALKKHKETHSVDAKYICSLCGKKFITYDTFRYHNKTHDGKRNHLCPVCGRAFLQSVHLKYHMWQHTGVKQFHCADCSKSYTSVTQLKKHRRKYCGSVTNNETNV